MAIAVGGDAYVSLADADVYHANYGNDTWSGATELQKEVAVRRATSYLDTYFNWRGVIKSTAQKLGWPRLDAFDAEGRVLTDIPEQIKIACCELSLLALNGPLVSTQTERLAIKQKAGSVEVEYAQSEINDKYMHITRILNGIGSLRNKGSGMVKLVK